MNDLDNVDNAMTMDAADAHRQSSEVFVAKV